MNNRVCIEKSTGRLIEYQMGGDTEDLSLKEQRLDTLKQNAINSGYSENEIEVKWVTDEEWENIKNSSAVYVSYRELRAKEYPDFKEYLDGIVKNDPIQIQAYVDACLAVKQKYPKE